jgi:16S rRNA (guanine966-N2)-methyltransferase
MLASLGVVEGARVWDLFAGSGAMGIEALSRGASHATFVEQARGALTVIRANLARLGYGPLQATVVASDVLSWVKAQAPVQAGAHGGAGRPGATAPVAVSAERATPATATAAATKGEIRVDLVTADPPYAWPAWEALLGYLAPFEPFLLAETGDELELPPEWRTLRSKRYGGTVVTLAGPVRPGAPAGELRTDR